jgi:pyruvate ferredoxin oxidoreductase gamma subunit
MFQIRIHGRGGQGVVSATEILSVAGFMDSQHAQAFPSFGSERTGAPVVAFCRFDSKPIRLREPVMTPDALIIQDPTLLHQVNLFEGLQDGGYVLINSEKSFAELGLGDIVNRLGERHCRTVPASALAQKHIGRPLPNAALLGGFVALTSRLKLESVLNAIRDKFASKAGEQNAQAAATAYQIVKTSLEAAHAQAN